MINCSDIRHTKGGRARLLQCALGIALLLSVSTNLTLEAKTAQNNSEAVARFAGFRTTLEQRPLTGSESEEFEKLASELGEDADVYFTVGLYCQRAGYVDLAISAYEKALHLSSNNSASLLALASIYTRGADGKANNTEAIARLVDRALYAAIAPSDLLKLALILDTGDAAAQADRIYKKLAAMPYTKDPAPANARACALMVMGRYAEAASQANVGLGFSATRRLALKVKSQSLAAQGKLEETLPYLQDLTKQFPFDVSANDLAATVYFRLQRPEDAVPYLLRTLACTGFDLRNKHAKRQLITVIRQLPNSIVQEKINDVTSDLHNPKLEGALHLALGDVYDRMNRYDTAVHHYQLGIKFMPDYGRAYMRIGKDIDRMTGDPVKSHPYYQRAFDLDSNNTEVRISFVRNESRAKNFKTDLAARLKSCLKSN